MIILTIKTDQPVAEIGLYDDNKKLAGASWQADRELAETIHKKIDQLLKGQKLSLANNQIMGVVCYKGPGSFTGLRIGFTVANSLAYGLQVPIVSVSGYNWQQAGINRLMQGENETVSLPDYGREPHITEPKK